ncbi:MAG: hypothetical protein ACRD04_06905 [Terriglobales bacterium]
MELEVGNTARLLWREAQAGRLQRSLALVAGLTSGLSGLEVGYMHYRAGFGQWVMWTPLVSTQALQAAGVAAAIAPRGLGRRLLPAVSAITLANCVVGFGFHLRGIARKPGGWRLLVPNVAMGPPPFAPLLLGISAYLGILATRLEPEFSRRQVAPEVREQLHRHLAAVTGLAALCSGTEALYSHHKNNFRYRAQYTPLMIAPALAAAGFASAAGRPGKKWLLPALAGLAMVDGAVGFFYHARGIARRPGGRKHIVYNIMYGPPGLAPLLFAACGFFGLLATALRGKR